MSMVPIEASCEQVPTPEALTKQIVFKPYMIEIIENKDVKKAIKQAEELNAKMFVDGWALSQMVEFIDSGNFKGFILTYKKAEERDTSKQ